MDKLKFEIDSQHAVDSRHRITLLVSVADVGQIFSGQKYIPAYPGRRQFEFPADFPI